VSNSWGVTSDGKYIYYGNSPGDTSGECLERGDHRSREPERDRRDDARPGDRVPGLHNQRDRRYADDDLLGKTGAEGIYSAPITGGSATEVISLPATSRT